MKIAVVSGASSGLGKGFVEALDSYSLDEIWVIARREDRLHALQTKCKTPVRIFAFDLLKESTFEIMSHILKSEQPNIAYLINAAGFGVFNNVETPLIKLNQMIDLNIKALVNMTYLCIPYMKKGSQIIQLGSSSSFTPLVNFNVYAATKAFVVHFSNALYQELKPKGIHVSVICPGWVKTEFFKQANYQEEKYAPKMCKPMYESRFVVEQALKDSAHHKMMSFPGTFTKMHYCASKLLPKKVVMTLWKWMQKQVY